MTADPGAAAAVVPPVALPMLELYLDLHRHPELSGEEERTAERVGKSLEESGFAVTGRVGGHGVVARLSNGEGPTVLLRAELDALPLVERTGLAYTSVGTAMHACGHDLHLAALCGAANVLAQSRDQWRGTVIAVGQPAEETLSGAAAMLADGLYTRWGRPDAALAQHIGPFPAGLVAHTEKIYTAAGIDLSITVFGRGGNAGQPDAALNPVPVAAAVVTQLTELFPGRPYRPDLVLLTIGAIRAGTRANVVAERATLLTTLRSLDPDALTRAVSIVETAVAQVCWSAECPRPPEIAVSGRSVLGVNDSEISRRVRAAHEGVFGRSRVLTIPPSWSTEDFPLFGRSPLGPVPTAYWSIGSVPGAVWAQAPGTTIAEKLITVPVNHSPEFAPDPVLTLRTATTALVAGTRSLLSDVRP